MTISEREMDFQSLDREDLLLFDRIRELQNPLNSILKQIKPQVEARKYGLLVSDDRGGRIPTLILGRTLNKYYNDKKQDPIPSIFIQGSRDASYLPLMHKVIKSHSRSINQLRNDQKALLVTEYIGMGRSMELFNTLFSSVSIPFDVAAIQVSASKESYQERGAIPDTSNLFSGNDELGVDFIDFPYTGLKDEKYPKKKFATDPILRHKSSLALNVAKNISEELLKNLTKS